MELEAKGKLEDGDYEGALLLYEKILSTTTKEARQQSSMFQLFLGKAQALILLLRYKETIDSFQKVLSIHELMDSDIVRIIDCLLRSLNRTKGNSFSDSHVLQCGKALCFVCKGILIEPVCISSGHTCCKSCTTKLDNKFLNGRQREQRCKVNITIQEVVSKYFKDEQEACRQRLHGNNLLKDGNIEQALEIYLEALKLGKLIVKKFFFFVTIFLFCHVFTSYYVTR